MSTRFLFLIGVACVVFHVSIQNILLILAGYTVCVFIDDKVLHKINDKRPAHQPQLSSIEYYSDILDIPYYS